MRPENIVNVIKGAAREPVLSPVDRVSELLFGLFMALTFVGAVSVASLVSSAEIESIRGRIVALPSVPARPAPKGGDLLASFAIFLIVVASTFPVVLPFALIQDVGTAQPLSPDCCARRPWDMDRKSYWRQRASVGDLERLR